MPEIERTINMGGEHSIVVCNNYDETDEVPYGWKLDTQTHRYLPAEDAVLIKFNGIRPSNKTGPDFKAFSFATAAAITRAIEEVTAALQKHKPEDPGRSGFWDAAPVGSTVTDGTTDFWVKVSYDMYVTVGPEGEPVARCEEEFPDNWYLGEPAEPMFWEEPKDDDDPDE